MNAKEETVTVLEDLNVLIPAEVTIVENVLTVTDSFGTTASCSVGVREERVLYKSLRFINIVFYYKPIYQVTHLFNVSKYLINFISIL